MAPGQCGKRKQAKVNILVYLASHGSGEKTGKDHNTGIPSKAWVGGENRQRLQHRYTQQGIGRGRKQAKIKIPVYPARHGSGEKTGKD